jgi:hypothetical protein
MERDWTRDTLFRVPERIVLEVEVERRRTNDG